MRVLEPHTVTVLTTDKCTAECRHCCMNSGPEREHTLSYAQMENALTKLFAASDVNVVVFAGGEPTLLGQDLYDAIKLCKLHGVVTRIVTNAYWATSLEAARKKCAELRDAGLDEFNVSMDDYHEPWISFDRVKFAYDAAMDFDFSAVVIANCGGPNSVLTPEFLHEQFDMSGAEMQSRFDVDGHSTHLRRQVGGKYIVLSNGNVQRLGRGADLVLDEECPHDGAMDEETEEFGGCPWAVQSCAISARGHLLSCCGFELHGNPILDYGDLATQDAGELLDAADNDLITNMISMIGPPKIMQLLQELCPDEIDFPRERYNSYCEACQDLVTIDKNRRALYKYQGVFAEVVMEARESLVERFSQPNGRIKNLTPVRLPGLRFAPPAPVESDVDVSHE